MSRIFEVRNSHELVDSLLSLHVLQNAKPVATSGRRATVKELASAIPLQGHDYSTYRTAVGKLMFMAPWRPDMQFAIQQLSTQAREPTTECRCAMKQLLRYLRGTNNTSLRLEPHAMVRENTIELVGRSDSDWAGDSATRQSITGFHCNLQGVMICNRSLKQTAISLSSCEAELSNELHYTVSVKMERWTLIQHDMYFSDKDQEASESVA